MTTFVKKQKSILDYFKSNKTPEKPIEEKAKSVISEPSKNANETKNNVPNSDPTKTVLFDSSNSNNKRPLENDASINFNSIEDCLLEVNFVDENLFLLSLEENDLENDSDKIFNINVINSDLDEKRNSTMYSYETFRAIIKTILTDPHFEHLFDENDWSQIQEFTSFTGPIQMLYIKLYMRKHGWIKTSNISYPEINSKCEHLNELKILLKHGFLLDSSSFESLDEAFAVMSLPDLKQFFKLYKGFKFEKNTAKAKVIPLFIEYIKTTRSVCSESKSSIENDVLKRLRSLCKNKCFKLNEEKSKLFDRIFLLYNCPYHFLDKKEKFNEDKWYRNILGDYSMKNEEYPVLQTNKSETLYTCRQEFIDFSEAFTKLCEVIVLTNQKRFNKVIDEYFSQIILDYLKCFNEWSEKDAALDLFLRPYTATGMYVRLLHQCLEVFEKARKYGEYIELVLQLLSQCTYGIRYRPHWYIKACIVSQCYLKNIELSEQFCRNGLNDNSIQHDHRIELYSRLLKMKKTTTISSDFCPEYYQLQIKKTTVYADYRRIENSSCDSYGKNFFFYTLPNGDEEIISVEEIVIRHYKKLNYKRGIHCESSIYHILFGLLFWDIIYSPEFLDSFRYYNQTVPIDLCFDSFYKRREDLIDQRVLVIEKFSENELKTELENSWQKYYCQASLLVNWGYIDLETLIEIAICFTAQKLAKILHILAKDYRHFRKGFPDLIVWNPETRIIKTIEVKGPLDRISSIQKIWLSYLLEFGIDAELCRVKPQSKN